MAEHILSPPTAKTAIDMGGSGIGSAECAQRFPGTSSGNLSGSFADSGEGNEVPHQEYPSVTGIRASDAGYGSEILYPV